MRLAVIMTALLLAALPARAGPLQDDAECRHNYAIWGMGITTSMQAAMMPSGPPDSTTRS